MHRVNGCVFLLACVRYGARDPPQAELLEDLQLQDQQRAQHLQERDLKLNPHVQGKGASVFSSLPLRPGLYGGRGSWVSPARKAYYAQDP